MLLYQLLACTTHGKIQKSHKNSQFKISASRWNEKFELPDGSYSESDIQDYFKHITKKHEKVTANPSIRIYVKRVQNRTTFRVKKGTISHFWLLKQRTYLEH